MPQGVDMGIAPTASHNGHQQRAKYIPDLWGVRAAELQRTVLNIWLEQMARTDWPVSGRRLKTATDQAE